MYRDLPWGTNEPDMKHCALLLDVHGYWFQPYVAWEHWRVATGAGSSAPAQQWIVHTQTFLIFSLACGRQCTGGAGRGCIMYYVLLYVILSNNRKSGVHSGGVFTLSWKKKVTHANIRFSTYDGIIIVCFFIGRECKKGLIGQIEKAE